MGEIIQLASRRQAGATQPDRGRWPRRSSRHSRLTGPGAGLRLARVEDADQDDGSRSAAIPSSGAGAAFYFELGCPAAYLAAERVERAFGQVTWVPTARLALACCRDSWDSAALLEEASREATSLRLPLIIPERFGVELRRAGRVAAFAAGLGAGGPFVLAASRLAFCGGYDIDAPPVLAEAARASGLDDRACLEAALDARWDEPLLAAAGDLAAYGVDTVPAIRIGSHCFQGLRAVSDGAAFCALTALREAAQANHS